jgi:uncharacterized protein YjbI with pentapeptide repeats
MLRRVSFCDADLRGATFKDADFSEVDLRWAQCSLDAIESDLSGARIR